MIDEKRAMIYGKKADILQWKRTHEEAIPFVFDRIDREPNAAIMRFREDPYLDKRMSQALASLTSVTILDSRSRNECWKDDLTSLNSYGKVHNVNGRYFTVIQEIRKAGSSASVFVVQLQDNSSKAVLKIPHSEYDKEHEVMKRIQLRGGHPNVVQFYDHQDKRGVHWILMEYIDGAMIGDGILTEKQIAQFKSAQSFLGSINVAWGDENPKYNLMITKDGNVKLIDFGTLAMN